MPMPPCASSTTAGIQTKGGQTTISSRVCPLTKGRKARMNSRACCGVLYIFQLAAISFLRGIVFLRTCYAPRRHGDPEKIFLLSPWLRVSVVNSGLVLVGQGLNAGQLFAFEKFEGSATAGRDVRDFVGHIRLVHGRNGVAAA